MTEAVKRPRMGHPLQMGVQLHYEVAMSRPESHLFEVTLKIKNWNSPVLDLKMPVWTPGSYLVREYARHLQNFTATGQEILPWQKLSKNHWQVETESQSEIQIHYQIFANELTVRTNHLDQTHGYFNGAALFFYIPGFEQQSLTVTIIPPRHWQIATALPAVPDQANTFSAADFDTLVDSPFEIGTHHLYDFEVLGKPHQYAIWSQGNVVPEQVIRDTQRIVETEAQIFGGLPYDRYLFLLHLSAQGYGGLEHKNCCTLNYPRLGFRHQEKYQRFLQLVAHEFFHLWNVKRIRPKALECFDYEAENYTPSLWFSEGTTSYYDLQIPWRAGIYDAKAFLSHLSKEITRYLTTPGRQVQPLSESSFDAWIKLYRPDANSPNAQISYYLKGEMVSFLLDLLIRQQHQNQRSLDDVLRQLWQQFGQEEIGFTPEQLQTVLETVSDLDLSDFCRRYLDTVEELPFNDYLKSFGLQLQAEGESDQPPFLGMTVKTENGREMIKFVEANSPAQQAGIDAGDELLAIAGLRITADQLNDRLRDFHPGESVTVTVFHQDELRFTSVRLERPRANRYQIVPVDHPSPSQQQLAQGWLGVPLSALKN